MPSSNTRRTRPPANLRSILEEKNDGFRTSASSSTGLTDNVTAVTFLAECSVRFDAVLEAVQLPTRVANLYTYDAECTARVREQHTVLPA